MGIRTQKKAAHFLLWVMVEIQRLRYTRFLNLYQMNSRLPPPTLEKISNSTHVKRLKVLFSDLISKDKGSNLHLYSLLLKRFGPPFKPHI